MTNLLPPLLAELNARLAAEATTAEAEATRCLDRISDPAGEGRRAFTRVYRTEALDAATASDRRRRTTGPAGPLDGIPISIKDLFDVAGETTLAGSVVLAGSPPAARDAAVVARLRAAGAVIVGKTNMTEFAYSGLGLNPHYGTPANPRDAARIPGGSSSGAGVAGPYGFAAASIGTDTGGSVRIPAAFCGVTGFKPTARRIPRQGTFPLSRSLDSIGPLARSVACCALLDAILAGEPTDPLPDLPLAGRRFLVPRGSFLTQSLDRTVAHAFETCLSILARAGAQLIETACPALDRIGAIARFGGIAAPEAWEVHRDLLAHHADRYDPRVRKRLMAARAIAPDDIAAAAGARDAARVAFDAATCGFDAVLCPTVPIVAPRFEALAEDAAYDATNALVLRNTAAFNLLDRCALTLPCQAPGDLPVGLMLVGETGGDRHLLAVGQACERALAVPGAPAGAAV